MYQYVAILRGINVGGKRKLLMADLRTLFRAMGFSDILTYIQSGNVLFKTTEKLSINHMESIISKAIEQKYAYDVPVIVRSASDWTKTIEINPFVSNDNLNQLHLTFLRELPDKQKVDAIKEIDTPNDSFEIIDNTVFILLTNTYKESKLSNSFFEKHLKVTATTRNWKTILKIAELLTENQ